MERTTENLRRLAISYAKDVTHKLYDAIAKLKLRGDVMFIIFGDIKYRATLKIPIYSLNNSIFAIRYFVQRIASTNTAWVGGIYLSPTNTPKKSHLINWFIMRGIFGNVENGLNLDTMEIEQRMGRGFPKVDFFSKVTELTSEEVGKNPQVEVWESELMKSVFESAFAVTTQMITLSQKIASYKTHKSREIAEFLALEQGNGGQSKARSILEFYEAFKTCRLLAAVNSDILSGMFKRKERFRDAFGYRLRTAFQNRANVKKESWDENIRTLDKYRELVRNERFVYAPQFIELQEKLKNFGVEITLR